jgi:hypothetical protein
MQTEVPPMHTRSIAQGQQNKTETLQRSNNSSIVTRENRPKALTQSNKVQK